VQRVARLQAADELEVDVLGGQAVEQPAALTEEERPELLVFEPDEVLGRIKREGDLFAAVR